MEQPNLKYSEHCKIAAEYRNCTVRTIKKNVRKMNDDIWKNERLNLFEMAGSCLKQQPSDKEFLQILLDEFIRTNGEVIGRYGSETHRPDRVYKRK